MLGRRRIAGGAVLAAAGFLGGCGGLERHREPKAHASASLLDSGPAAKVTGQQAADVQFAIGREHEEAGKLDAAEKAYRAALAKAPKRADVEGRLAIVLDQRGAAAEADEHFERALKLAPKDPEILCDRGYCLYLRGRADAAERSTRSALAVAPSHARAHTNLGLILAARDDTGAALAEFARAGLDHADARANLALALALGGRVEAARDQYAQALAAKPDLPAAAEGLRVASSILTKHPAGKPADLPGLPGDPAPAALAAGPATRVDPAVVPTSLGR